MIRPSPFHKPATRFFFRLTAVFVALFILTVPFSRSLLPDPGRYIAPLFEPLTRWSGEHLFRIKPHATFRLLSDSTGLYIHLLHLVLLSGLLAGVWFLADRRGRRDGVLYHWFLVGARYYLAAQLLTYGFNKVFKWQFFLPEPNTLFTTVGQTPKDLLYWTVMGASWPYTVFTGLLEVLAGLLLLFRCTALPGALLSLGILLNVMMINFSYDISVKVYSAFLLLLTLLLVVDGRRKLYPLIGKAYMPQPGPEPGFRGNGWQYRLVKVLVIACLLADACYPYLTTGNLDDDTARRPTLHGAYEVRSFTRNGDLLPPLLTDTVRWRRMFIHRRGYFITQSMSDGMTDYPLSYDTASRHLYLEQEAGPEIVLHYAWQPDSTLQLDGQWRGAAIRVQLAPVDLRRLPLLQNGFHWTMDW